MLFSFYFFSCSLVCFFFFFFFFNDTATTEIYTLSLHDALPISPLESPWVPSRETPDGDARRCRRHRGPPDRRVRFPRSDRPDAALHSPCHPSASPRRLPQSCRSRFAFSL